MRQFFLLLAVFLAVGGVIVAMVVSLPRAASVQPNVPASISPATSGGHTSSPHGKTNTQHVDVADASSLLVVVNKRRPLSPRDYVPADLVTVNVPDGSAEPVELRRPAAKAVKSLFAAFQRDTGHRMESESSYRSFTDQRATYDQIKSHYGSGTAEDSAALPGYSEHQTGLAIDIGQLDSTCRARECFAATPAGIWLRSNAWKFGFIIRYPPNQGGVTGYEYEPWHLRYLGPSVAKSVHFHFSSLEAYFGLPAAPDYAR